MYPSFPEGKTQAHREGSRTVEEYTCGITQTGITTHGNLAQHKGWPWANTRVLHQAWLPRVREELQQDSSRGTELRSNKSARIRSVEGNGAASVIETELVPVLLDIQGKCKGEHRLYTEVIKSRKRIRCRPAGSSTNVCYRGAQHQCPGGRNASRRVCSHTEGAR